jgi:hypothetical protein
MIDWDFGKLNEDQKTKAREATINYDYDQLRKIYKDNKLASVKLGSCCWEEYLYNWFKYALDNEFI